MVHVRYGHLGLHRQYLRLKSIQRFTETWALLERAALTGIFDVTHGHPRRAIRVASMGGGPGYELIAFDWFLNHYHGSGRGTSDMISMDLEKSWGPYVRGLRVVRGEGGGGNRAMLSMAVG